MAVKIRLRRMGSTNKPFYRIVVTESRFKRDGKYLEEIGYYNPIIEPPKIKIDEEVALNWIEKGAKVSDRVMALFKKQGILDKLKERKRKLEEGESR